MGIPTDKLCFVLAGSFSEDFDFAGKEYLWRNQGGKNKTTIGKSIFVGVLLSQS